jgi:hypothetical protein
MAEQSTGNAPSWAREQEGFLSPHAVRVFERLGVRRDPARACGREELAALLEEHGLPVFEPVLEFERRFGGVTWGEETFGAGAALRSGFDLRMLAGLTGCDLQDYLGEPFVPVSFRSYLPRAYFWMNGAGTIYLSNEVESFPAADSAAVFWEREALKAGGFGAPEMVLLWASMPTGTDADFKNFENRPAPTDEDEDDKPPATYDEDPQAPFDAAFAAPTKLPVFYPATDRWRRVWFDGARLLYPHHPWRPADRLVRAADMDNLVRLVSAAKAIRPTVLVTFKGPSGAPPSPGEPIAEHALAHEEGQGVVGEWQFIGEPGAYRAHLRRDEQPRSLYRLWQEREEAWEARRSGR